MRRRSQGNQSPLGRELWANIEWHVPNCHERLKPWDLSAEEQKAKGYDRETWNLEIVGDPPTVIDEPRTVASGNALTFADLLNAAKARVVRVPKCMTGLDVRTAFGSALWEGVPLRDLLWLVRPNGSTPIRRISAYAFQVTDGAREQWCSSLAPARVFEDPFGLPPVLLAFRFDGEAPEAAGPRRPEGIETDEAGPVTGDQAPVDPALFRRNASMSAASPRCSSRYDRHGGEHARTKYGFSASGSGAGQLDRWTWNVTRLTRTITSFRTTRCRKPTSLVGGGGAVALSVWTKSGP